jgi:hypothetical protein
LAYLKKANTVATVRSERGYSATNYDASPAKLQKTLPRQIGQKYDAKKIRNNLAQKQTQMCPSPTTGTISFIAPRVHADCSVDIFRKNLASRFPIILSES